MDNKNRTPNRLAKESSPYLQQHAYNPVDWYPWGEEAFDKARQEDKPVFLSIGYSTCHWCHVMARESFEDVETARLLNEHYIAVKVDKEERPDLDSIYMTACQAFTGSGGWPTSVFLTPEQKPFFAGTYFPNTSRGGMIGFKSLLSAIAEKWSADRQSLLRSAEETVALIKSEPLGEGKADERLLEHAASIYRRSFDAQYGGFGPPPKFPAPHNLLFLLERYTRTHDRALLEMAEKTLTQMYRGGLFDHIGYGFCRYSTDRYYLVPHFEKMLYDNALMILTYAKAYCITKRPFHLAVAERTAAYVLREMQSSEGGFFSAQDADSDGGEGLYYVFKPDEITRVLGEREGRAFCRYYGITKEGNFEGMSVPNLLGHDIDKPEAYDKARAAVYTYRLKRRALHLDDKILTVWNGLMIAALCELYLATRNSTYLEGAVRADRFIKQNLLVGDALHVSYRDNRRGEKGFLDDYAYFSLAQLALYQATLENAYLDAARRFCEKALADYRDEANGGFFLYGTENERLILRPKETYDSALPSGNSVMAYVLARLYLLTSEEAYEAQLHRQLAFMAAEAARYPAGYAVFLLALTDTLDPPKKITVSPEPGANLSGLRALLPVNAVILCLTKPDESFPLLNGRTAFYVCQGHTCLPPMGEIEFVQRYGRG